MRRTRGIGARIEQAHDECRVARTGGTDQRARSLCIDGVDVDAEREQLVDRIDVASGGRQGQVGCGERATRQSPTRRA